MRRSKKLTLMVALCSALAAVSTAAGVATVAPTQTIANAEETTTAAFAMVGGAQVRAVENESGIRWKTNVNKAWVDAKLSNVYNVSYGTFVTGAAKVDGDVTKLNADNIDTYSIKDLPCRLTPDFTSETTSETTFTYYSSITYTAAAMADWTDAEKLNAYATELIARSYVKYTTSEDSSDYTYVYADAEDSSRCMRAIALTATENNPAEGEEGHLTDVQLGYIDGYFSEKATDAVDFGGYYETTSPEEVTTYTAAYIGAKKVGAVSDGALALNESDVTLGGNYTLTLFDANGNYAKTSEFQYITAALGDLDTFKTHLDVSGTLTGYYVLTANIALGDTYLSNQATFSGVLDGNGHTVSGISNKGADNGTGGLFGELGNGAVENVKLQGVVYAGGGLLAGSFKTNCTSALTDVYFEATLRATTQRAVIARAIWSGHTTTLTNVVTNVVKVVDGTLAAYAGTNNAGAYFGMINTNASIAFEGCYYVATQIEPISAYQTENCYTSASSCTKDGWKHQSELLGAATTKDNVVTYAKATGLTGYVGASAADNFKTAVTDGKVSLSEVLKTMMYSTTNGTSEDTEN